jgi:hypothetical protein
MDTGFSGLLNFTECDGKTDNPDDSPESQTPATRVG